MTSETCLRFEACLDAIAAGTLPETEAVALKAHATRCDACRPLLEMATGRGSMDPGEADDLAGAILERTSGPACAAAEERLVERFESSGAVFGLDSGSAPVADALLDEHLGRCVGCRRFAVALELAASELPSYAEADPGPAFVGAVLRATSGARTVAWPVSLWRRVVQRPRVALEWAYAGALAGYLAAWAPSAPLRPVTDALLDDLRRPVPESRASADAPVRAAPSGLAFPFEIDLPPAGELQQAALEVIGRRFGAALHDLDGVMREGASGLQRAGDGLRALGSAAGAASEELIAGRPGAALAIAAEGADAALSIWGSDRAHKRDPGPNLPGRGSVSESDEGRTRIATPANPETTRVERGGASASEPDARR